MGPLQNVITPITSITPITLITSITYARSERRRAAKISREGRGDPLQTRQSHETLILLPNYFLEKNPLKSRKGGPLQILNHNHKVLSITNAQNEYFNEPYMHLLRKCSSILDLSVPVQKAHPLVWDSWHGLALSKWTPCLQQAGQLLATSGVPLMRVLLLAALLVLSGDHSLTFPMELPLKRTKKLLIDY